jgi:hypothetical protein
MANLTITIDQDVLRRARLKALQEGTSVNRMLRQHLETYVEEDHRWHDAVRKLLRLSKRATSGSGGRRSRRQEVYER